MEFQGQKKTTLSEPTPFNRRQNCQESIMLFELDHVDHFCILVGLVSIINGCILWFWDVQTLYLKNYMFKDVKSAYT